MDILVGPTFTVAVSPPQAAAAYSLSQPETQRLLLKHRVSSVEEGEEDEDGLVGSISISNRSRFGLPMAGSGKSLEDSSDSSSSSVGAPDDSDEEEEDDGGSNSSSGASSSMKKGLGSLGSMDALEDSLPTKKGLSNYFAGKSKSFASLSDACLAVSQAKDLEKPEHPFNKRRRILMANKWSRRSSFYSWHNPKSMPLLTLNEDDDDESGDHNRRRGNEEDDEEEEDRRESLSSSSSSDKDEEDGRRAQRKLLQERRFNNSFKSHSCFSLTDLQEQQRRQREIINLPPRR
ncbi:unnamed protein product [Linum tenue]|uniref:Uncharacterized protein n=1 Tax=Linum tenue TaxID=586396 RepID=A0AAV0LWU2_9ROSI|nr:unnamed protein product [Linum tenue]